MLLRSVALALAFSAASLSAQSLDLVTAVRAATGAKDWPRAERLIADHRVSRGATTESILAVSWLARGALVERRWDVAETFARQARTEALAALKGRPVDADPFTPGAIGNADRRPCPGFGRARRPQRRRRLSPGTSARLSRHVDRKAHSEDAESQHARGHDGAGAGPVGVHWRESRRRSRRSRGRSYCSSSGRTGAPTARPRRRFWPRSTPEYKSQGLSSWLRRSVTATSRVARRRRQPKRRSTSNRCARSTTRCSPASRCRSQRPIICATASASTPTLALLDRQGIVRLYNPGRMTAEALETIIQKLISRGPNTRLMPSTTAASTSAIATARPSTRSIDVTPLSAIPHGTMSRSD